MPERSDAEQEGITLGNAYAARMIATEEARKVILQHLDLCPFAGLKIEQRVRNLEVRFAMLTGLMMGSGLIGGATAAAITRLVQP